MAPSLPNRPTWPGARTWPVLLLICGVFPLLIGRPAPLQDWPNHVARVSILSGLLQHDPFWTRFYRFTGFMVPNAALDLGILALHQIGLSVALAAECFLVSVYGVFVLGFCALAKMSGALDPTKAALAVLFFYCAALFWGLVNYLLGAGLLLGLLALWIDQGERIWSRATIAVVGSVLILFTHEIAAVAWLIVLVCFEAWRYRTTRRLLPALPLLLAIVVMAGLMHGLPADPAKAAGISYPGGDLGGIALRKLFLFGKVLRGGSQAQDTASLIALIAAVVCLGLSRPRLSPPAALSVVMLIAATFLAPERVGGGSQLDTRLALLPLLLLAACLRVRAAPLASATLTATVIVRSLVLGWCWHDDARVFRAYRHDIAQLPPGAVMMAAYGTPPAHVSRARIWSPPISALATLAVGRGLFVPSIFANPAQQPMALRPQFELLDQPWDLTDDARLDAARTSLEALCQQHRFTGVYLTVLYPGDFLPAALHVAPAADFLLLDGCKIRALP